jgi:hypothetical protein
MIGHLAVAVTYPVEAFADRGEGFQPRHAIFIGQKYVLTPVPAGGNVIERTGKFES